MRHTQEAIPHLSIFAVPSLIYSHSTSNIGFPINISCVTPRKQCHISRYSLSYFSHTLFEHLFRIFLAHPLTGATHPGSNTTFSLDIRFHVSLADSLHTKSLCLLRTYLSYFPCLLFNRCDRPREHCHISGHWSQRE